MRRLYLLPKVELRILGTWFLIGILLGAFITITYQPAVAAEPPSKPMKEQMFEQKKETSPGEGTPCGNEDPPVTCVGVAISPSPNEFGCTTGLQCSLSTQNKSCGAMFSGMTCKTETFPAGSATCRCVCKR